MRKPNGYWTKERCAEIAGLYNYKIDFINHDGGVAYHRARDKGWIPEICAHMIPKGNRYFRLVYRIICEETRKVYIGLTYDINLRQRKHRSSKRIVDEFGSDFILEPITELITAKEAQRKEQFFIDDYISKGYFVVNRTKAGALGCGNRWTIESSAVEAKKYKTRTDFARNSAGCYQACSTYGWLDSVCSHMTGKTMWNYEKCAIEALKYKTRKQFSDSSPGAYGYARKRGMLDEICKHMVQLVKPNGYWTKARCAEIASLFNTRSSFKYNHPSVYAISRRDGWLDEICSHMV